MYEGVGGIQLIDLEREHLKVRGRINRNFVPRRSAFHRGTIVAIGNSDLLTADTVDRDNPKILAEVQLAWRTDFAWPIGNYLLQLGADIGGANPSITVSPASDPDAGLTTVQLEAGRILTADLRDGYLYVVQQGPLPDVVPMVIGYVPPATYRLSIFNVASLPQIVTLGTVTLNGKGTWTNSVQLLWPDAGTAVLAATEQGSVYGDIRVLAPATKVLFTTQDLVATPSAGTTFTTSLGMPYYTPSWAGVNLIACNVTNPAAPAPVSWTFLEANSGNFSEVFAAAGKVFVTRQNGWGYVTFYTLASFAPQLPVTILPDLSSRGRHFLHVVDYANPSSPVSRPPVSAPGVLRGLTRGDTIVYTEGWQYNEFGIGVRDYACSPRLRLRWAEARAWRRTGLFRSAGARSPWATGLSPSTTRRLPKRAANSLRIPRCWNCSPISSSRGRTKSVSAVTKRRRWMESCSPQIS
jgi:hypothetical protein